MDRRGFLKAFGVTSATTLIPTAILFKIAGKEWDGSNCRYVTFYDGVNDEVYHRIDWMRDGEMMGVDFKVDWREKTKEEIEEQSVKPAFKLLKDNIIHKYGRMYRSETIPTVPCHNIKYL